VFTQKFDSFSVHKEILVRITEIQDSIEGFVDIVKNLGGRGAGTRCKEKHHCLLCLLERLVPVYIIGLVMMATLTSIMYSDRRENTLKVLAMF